MSAAPTEGAPAAPPSQPRDALAVAALLRSQGIQDFEPRVVAQLLEFMHRYVREVLVDAVAFQTHAEKPALRPEDVRLALQARLRHAFTQPPSREVLLALAEERNRVPLPTLPSRPGLLLPPPTMRLTAQNYRLVAAGEKPPGVP